MRALLDRLLAGAALVVTDRRWAAPLSAMALGFGLFVGVAIGPNAAGTLAGTTPLLLADGGGESEEAEAGEAAPQRESGGASLSGSGEGGGLGTLPLAPPPSPEPEAEAGAEPAPRGEAPAEEAPEEEEEVALEGVVVGANEAAGSYALAIAGGELVAVHAGQLPAPGTKLSLSAERLANDTFAATEKPETKGKVAAASFRGAVTYVDPDPADPGYTVSSRGVSLPVAVRPDPSGAAPALPPLGSYATVAVAIEAEPTAQQPLPAAAEPASGCSPDPSLLAQPPDPSARLWQRTIEVEGEPSTYLDLAGVVSAVCAEEGRLLLSADGARERDADLSLAVPAKISTARLKVGDSVLATAELAADGSLTLAGLAGDEQLKGASDASSAQGDLKR